MSVFGMRRRNSVEIILLMSNGSRRLNSSSKTSSQSHMRILFIGGTGNISTDCAALFHQRGHEISVVTRGNARVPAEYRAITADRKNLDAMRRALDDVTADVVINFLGYGLSDIETDYALFAGKIRRYIFISTAMVYAKPHRQIP